MNRFIKFTTFAKIEGGSLKLENKIPIKNLISLSKATRLIKGINSTFYDGYHYEITYMQGQELIRELITEDSFNNINELLN